MPAPGLRLWVVLILTGLISACGLAQTISERALLKKYVAQDSSFILYKPQDWKVREQAGTSSVRIIVSDPGETSIAEVYCASNPAGRVDALGLLADFGRSLKAEHPDLAFSGVYVSGDRSKAVGICSYLRGNVRIQGRYYFDSTPRQLSVQGYCAPETALAARRALLINILSNLHFVSRETDESGRSPRAGLEPVHAELVQRRPSDNSLNIAVPADWVFLAGGGKVLTAAPQGRAGFVSTSFTVIPPGLTGENIAQGVISSPYLPPAGILPTIFSKLGDRNVKILGSQRDSATVQACGGQCQAEDMEVSWTSPEGIACVGVFKSINSAPRITGIWTTLLSGIWGPQEEFLRWIPLLEQVASSYRIDDQFARSYVQAGLANLRRLQAKTAQSMQSLNEARRDNQLAWEQRQARKDASDARWDDYRRGQSYWVSEMEGGKVYATDMQGIRDSRTGDYREGSLYGYVNFEGRNPRHPSETMREVRSYEVQQLLNSKP